jgi:hypothetical protein
MFVVKIVIILPFYSLISIFVIMRKPLTKEEKIKANLRSKLWRKNNKTRIKLYNEEYNSINKEKNYENHRQWVINNPEKAKLIKEKWNKNNKCKIKETKKKWDITNTKHNKEYCKNYREMNPDKVKEATKKLEN